MGAPPELDTPIDRLIKAPEERSLRSPESELRAIAGPPFASSAIDETTI
jgi:hypothetical protein